MAMVVPKGGSNDTAQAVSPLPSLEGDAIRVFVRIRPLEERSLVSADSEQGLCLSVLSTNTIRLHSKPEPKTFTYDHVANMDATQESVFSCVAKNIVESCMNGYNGTIFAYGQTGSGKTFTMLGPSDSDNFSHSMRGVIPRSLEYLFFLISREKEKAEDGKSFLCKCSFIEIYNEQIFDLLDSASAGLFLREHIKKGVFVVGVLEQVVTTAAEAYQVLSMGWRNRRVASTSMNRESSRSHAVFTVTIQSMEKNNDIVNIRSSQLNLVDLAGSERQKDTHSEGVRLKEAGSINRSLSCLGQVITALVDVSNGKQRHICYRDSKLTFLLRDSLGGNAKTFIIANVHPGSKCFGETLSTLHFAQRAKLIKNKAVVNEDTQGNVSQLQAEVKRLKEQLSQLISGQMMQDNFIARAPVSPDDYTNRFLEAMLFLEKSECEKKSLLGKVAQLEDLCAKKEKFIQSNKMIVKFREDHIARLERITKQVRSPLSGDDQDDLIADLRQEVQTLKEQVAHHPRVAKYALENHGLREEIKRLQSLQAVKRAEEMDAQTIAVLERAFLEASSTNRSNGGQPMHSTPVSENKSLASVERLKARLLQMQSELANSKQEYEEFKELTMKKQLELESELQSCLKANQHLENILEATKAHTRHEVLQLNKMHVETIKNLTTPTKAYNLRSRLVPRLSPEILENGYMNTPTSGIPMEDILKEPVPPEMNEQAYEAIAEELRIVQEQVHTLQAKLDDEASKSMKLQQQVDKLEHHSAQMQELCSSERANRSKEQQDNFEQIKAVEKQLQDTLSKNDILKSEVHDLRVVLQSADKELSAVKLEYNLFKEKQDKEMGQLSDRHMNVQLQLDSIRLEHENLLEERRFLQDSYDNLEEVMKFETDQLKQQIQDSKQEKEALKAELNSLLQLLEAEKENQLKLTSQLQEDKESKSKELLKVLDENMLLKKQISELMARCEQQTAELQNMEQNVISCKEIIADLEITNAAEKEVVTDLMSQIHELRTSIHQKSDSIDVLTREIEEINCKYSSVLAEKEESQVILENQERQIEELREELERKQSADNIEKELLCDDLAYATEQLDKLTEASKVQEVFLRNLQEDLQKKEAQLQELQNQNPRTLPSFELHSSEMFESHEKELENQRTFITTLELLISELTDERAVKNDEILNLKGQLCEMENLRLENQNLLAECHNLQTELADARTERKRSDLCEQPNMEHLKEMEKEVAERKLVKNESTEIWKVGSELAGMRNTDQIAKESLIEMTKERERIRALEYKALQDKEELKSKLEVAYEETDKCEKELTLLRKQVEYLAEENGKLVGHQNLNQKIQYLVKLKKENARLTEEVEKLRFENAFLKDVKKI
ncbi:kinesin-like protein KIF15 isoform X2 [Rhinatrema bivittatum]|uniref:kinesin-like protein KIF15 isoform X2 n=1 Tax=Rhinatrema bivittatum TaxID=194408 RepID=UPI00112EDFCD|nr:kinesin-like protein KIF15 isoform X2 [Rhinatrema bivittatum]